MSDADSSETALPRAARAEASLFERASPTVVAAHDLMGIRALHGV